MSDAGDRLDYQSLEYRIWNKESMEATTIGQETEKTK